MTKNVAVFAVGAALCALALSGSANAATNTGTLTVTASVAQNCTVSDALLGFGPYDPVQTNNTTPIKTTATTTLTCTKGATGITLSMGPSANNPAGCTGTDARCMADSGNYLNYQLYSDSAYSTVWNATGVAETVAGGISAPTSVTIYGEVPAAQDASIGASYSDSIVETVNF